MLCHHLHWYLFMLHVCACVCNVGKFIAHLLIELIVILDHQFFVVHL